MYRIFDHIRDNFKFYVPGFIIFVFILWLIFSGDSSSGSSASTGKIPGGGLGTFLIAALTGLAAYRSKNKWLMTLTVILVFVAIYPLIWPVANDLGINPSMIRGFIKGGLLLLLGMVLWIWRKGGGPLKYTVTFLLVLSVFQPTQYLVAGWNEAKKGLNSVGITMPDSVSQTWQSLRNKADGASEVFLAESEKEKVAKFARSSKSRTAIIKRDTPLYTRGKNGGCNRLTTYNFRGRDEVQVRIGSEDFKTLIQVFLPDKSGDLFAGAIEAYVPAERLEIQEHQDELIAEKRARRVAEKKAADAKIKEMKARLALADQKKKRKKKSVKEERRTVLLPVAVSSSPPKTRGKTFDLAFLPNEAKRLLEDLRIFLPGTKEGNVIKFLGDLSVKSDRTQGGCITLGDVRILTKKGTDTLQISKGSEFTLRGEPYLNIGVIGQFTEKNLPMIRIEKNGG